MKIQNREELERSQGRLLVQPHRRGGPRREHPQRVVSAGDGPGIQRAEIKIQRPCTDTVQGRFGSLFHLRQGGVIQVVAGQAGVLRYPADGVLHPDPLLPQA